MKLKLSQIWNPALQRIIQEKVDMKLSYRLEKILRVIEPEQKKIEEQRVTLINKYADEQTPDDIKNNRKNVTIKIKEFTDELNPILEQEVEFNIDKIPFGLLEQNIRMSALEFGQIKCFVQLPDEDKTLKLV